MHASFPSLVLGFHGCDAAVGEDVLAGRKELRLSRNDYDWLGRGAYFWENDPQRALAYARFLRDHPRRARKAVSDPFVLGAVIDLGKCLNLLNSKNLALVKQAYEGFQQTVKKAGGTMPRNEPASAGDTNRLLRYLDCAIIDYLYETNKDTPFDSIRAVYVEGEPLYPSAGFHARNHIQICVKDHTCIRGFFRPR